MNNQTNDYKQFIEQIFDFDNIDTEKSFNTLRTFHEQNLIQKFNSSHEKGLEDIQSVQTNQDQYGANKTSEQIKISICRVIINYMKRQIYNLFAFMIPLYQMYYCNDKDENYEEQYYYKCICAILIIKILYETFIEIYIVRMSYRHLRNEDDQKVQVIRDKIQFIQQSELVVGDILLFSVGDTLPVDGILIEGTSVIVDESYYTLNKCHLQKLPFQINQQQQDQYTYYYNPLLISGTKCVNGKGKIFVLAVGNNKLQSRLQFNNLQQHKSQMTSNIFQINEKVFWINLTIFSIMTLIILIILALQIFHKFKITETFDMEKYFTKFTLDAYIVYLISAVYFTTPEVISLYLVLLLKYFLINYGTQKLEFKDGNVIESYFKLKKIIIQNQNIFYSNLQQFKTKKIIIDSNQYLLDDNFARQNQVDRILSEQITKCIFCNLISIPIKDSHTNMWICKQDQIDQSLIDMSMQLGQEYDQYIFNGQVFVQMFHPNGYYISSIYQNKINKQCRLYTKGNTIQILNICTNYLSSNGQVKEFTQNEKNIIRNQLINHQNQPSIYIALAYKDLNELFYISADVKDQENNLTFIGLIEIQNTINKDQFETINYCRENNISVVLSKEMNQGQLENLLKVFQNQENDHQGLAVIEESLPQANSQEENLFSPDSVIIRNGNLEQTIKTLKQSKKFQRCFKNLILIALQNKITILNVIFLNFIQIDKTPYNIFQIVYLFTIFDVFIPIIVIIKSFCSEFLENQNEHFENDETFKNSTIINQVLSTFIFQILNYYFCEFILPYGQINSQLFQHTIFFSLTLFTQVHKAATQNLQNSTNCSILVSFLLSISIMLLNYLFLTYLSDLLLLYPIYINTHNILLLSLIFFALIIQHLIDCLLRNFKYDKQSYNILNAINDKVSQLTSFVQLKQLQDNNQRKVERNEIASLILQINLEQQKREFKQKQQEYKTQITQQIEEEIRQQKKREQEKHKEESRSIEITLQQLKSIESNQNISENKKQYKRAMISQKLIVSMLEQNQAFKIEKPQVTDLEIKDNNNSSNKDVQLNENLLLYVLKESLPTNVELVKTTECVGGLDSLITGQNDDQSCLRLKVNDNINEPNFDKNKYIKNLKSQISKKLQVEAEKVEILECFEDNSNRIDIKIEGFDRELTKEETQFFQQVCNANVEHFKYFQQANEKYQQGNKALIGLSTKDFNPKFNMTWKNFVRDSEVRGPSNHRYSYYYPKTCLGYGLQVSNKYENDNWLKMDGNPDEWRILYHATQQDFTVAIAKNGLQVGRRQAYKDSICRFTNQRVGVGIYFSDKIEACRQYCQSITIDGKNIIVYFMSRVRPSAIRQSVQMQRINYFVVNNSKDIRPYRILLEEV